jgi:hypothetical protein
MVMGTGLKSQWEGAGGPMTNDEWARPDVQDMASFEFRMTNELWWCSIRSGWTGLLRVTDPRSGECGFGLARKLHTTRHRGTEIRAIRACS